MTCASEPAAPPTSRAASRPRSWTSPPRLHALISMTVMLPLVPLGVVLIVLFGLASRRIAAQLGETLLDHSAARVQSDLAQHLGSAVRTSDLYARRLSAGTLPVSGLIAWEPLELDDLVSNPDVASICFGAATGETTWVLRARDGLELGRVDAATGLASDYRIEPSGTIDATPLRTYQYDPRERPWYRAATDRDGPRWTPIYFWFGDRGTDTDTGVGYSRPIRKATGELAGVLVIDVTLGHLSGFLASLPLARSGALFVIDHEGLIVASSRGTATSAHGDRLPLERCGVPEGRAVAAMLAHPRRTAIQECAVEGRPAWVRVTPFCPHPGIDWRIVAVVPRAALLADSAAVRRRALWASGVTAAAGLALALGMSRRLASPLLALAAHVRRVGAGDFAARIDLRAARELTEVSDELNRMTAGLRQRLELQQALSLAMEVQQGLLPRGAPAVAGLDVAGSSRYCDATGGDYYDFIEITGTPAGGVIVAVGDVMGHGIAAALLMTTARAAVRAFASTGLPLGELMTRVNTVLARDARHGRFMTLILVHADPGTRSFRWSSAGHGSPLIYDPGLDRFLTPGGGNVPLGIVEDVAFDEHRVADLPCGAVLILGTDGIWEATDQTGEMFGTERLRALIRRLGDRPSIEILRGIDEELIKFSGGQPAQDDITAVVVRFTCGDCRFDL